MATTFTILAVFLPVGFMTGIVGQFFKSFALTIAFAVAMSLLVAFTLDPMLSSRFVRFIPPEERMRTRTGRFLERSGPVLRPHRRRLSPAARLGARAPVDGRSARPRVVFVASLSTLSASSAPSSCRPKIAASSSVHRRAAAGHVVRAERGAGRRRSSRRVGRDARSPAGLLAPSASTASPLKAVAAGARPTQEARARARPRGDQGRRARRSSTAIPLLKIDGRRPGVHAGRAVRRRRINVYVRGDDMAELQRLSDEIVTKITAGARRRRRRQHARDRPAGDGRARQSRAGGRPRLRRRQRSPTQLRGMVEGVVPTQAARRRQGVRHPRAAGAGVPQRLRGDRAHAALLAHAAPWCAPRDIVRMEPGVGPDQHRPRAAPPAGQDRHRARRTGRSATSPPTSRR